MGNVCAYTLKGKKVTNQKMTAPQLKSSLKKIEKLFEESTEKD